jgi:phosphopantetheinyl transferase (holo-ACP synthase)
MSIQITLEYLSKLLNKPITEGLEITLSSAQKSRLYAWLTKSEILFNESVLNGKFTVDQLLCQRIEKMVSQSSDQNSASSLPDVITKELEFGVDIQRVDELFPQKLSYDPKLDEEITHIFTVRELSYAQSKEDPEVTLTGIFCAKEAIQKIANDDKNLNEIEVLPDGTGRPTSNGYLLSISHSGNYAFALAIKLTKNPDCAPYPEIKSENVPIGKIASTLRLLDFIFLAFFTIIFIALLSMKF